MTNQTKHDGIRFRFPLKLKRKSSQARSTANLKPDVILPETASEHSEQDPSNTFDPASNGTQRNHDSKAKGLKKKLQLPFTLNSSASSCQASPQISNITSVLDVLSTDVQLQVFSFLDLTSLRHTMATNRAFRALLVSDSSYQVWHAMCQQRFSMQDYDSEHGMFLQDEFSLPIAVSGNNVFCRYNRVNLPLLLSMVPRQLPTGMDEPTTFPNSGSLTDAFSYGSSSFRTSLIKVFSPESDDSLVGPNHLDASFCSTSTSSSSDSCIRLSFNGDAASGHVDSIKANYPLPKPTRHVPLKKKRSKINLPQLRKRNRPVWNPMMIPYQSLADHTSRLIHVTPRLVSYFEISITKAPDVEPSRPRLADLDQLEQPRSEDCVAIGLATESFSPQATLPGWDMTSFGYHGDNGGLYHGSGHSQQRTEAFGPGDTVGIGVDYVSKTIFVTKNGRYLGTAYEVFTVDFLTSQDFYPVVGMGSKDTVHVNYGGVDQPFHFNLASYCHRQQQHMVSAKSRIARKFRFSN
ncbi:unnamed protein product [Cylindrotheca closterium]|uniref:B30.2/SPRY domain-containing protein n=1 Tax=Cylindrotheca closterium TaxID=2856 RepID=A0AAD2JPT9_9STRA|nr:unnamed protein product [Cylindrotheca closterium]